jgi:hypothetical protein
MTYKEGESYRVESPNIPGYDALRTLVEGTMGAKNEEITVRYKAKAATPSPTPTPFPDNDGCVASGGTFDAATGNCACPEGSQLAPDKKACVKVGE